MTTKTTKVEVPETLKGLPKKMVLLGGGQFANQFIEDMKPRKSCRHSIT